MTVKSLCRRLLTQFNRAVVPLTTGVFDRYYLDPAVPAVDDTNYLARAVEHGNKPGARILEIGSREVTGPSTMRSIFPRAHYVGFDFHSGPNVDVVGDAHRLSEYFFEPFDVILSTAVFEHLAAPWVVAEEIRKLLKVGGLVVVHTHFSYSSHQRPWNFFQFSDMGLKALFPDEMGFECIHASMSNPMIGRFSSLACDQLRYRPIAGLYCSSQFIGAKVREVPAFNWRAVETANITDGHLYPNSAQD